MGNRRDRRAEKSRQRKADYESNSFKTLVRTAKSMATGKGKSPDRVVPSPCGHCGKELDGASSSDGVTAKPGDITVCIYCAGVNMFGDGMSLRAMTDDEVATHEACDDILAHQGLLKAMLGKFAMGGKKNRTPEA